MTMTNPAHDSKALADDLKINTLAGQLAEMSSDDLKSVFDTMRDRFDYTSARLLVDLPEKSFYNEAPEGVKTYVGIAVDTETTGLIQGEDVIIELGIVGFEFDQAGNIYHVRTLYSGYEDTDREITEIVTRKTGITKEMIAGHSFDDKLIASIVNDAAMVIAHNATFDRQMLEARFEVFKEKHWACSLRDIDWDVEDIEGRSLHALLTHYGYQFKGHRAEVDCRALVHLLTMPLQATGESVLLSALDAMRVPTWHVFAYKAPFEMKDALSRNGYRWHGGDALREKCWNKVVATESALEEELKFLRTEIYPTARQDLFRVEEIGSLVRYSNRAGEVVAQKVAPAGVLHPERKGLSRYR